MRGLAQELHAKQRQKTAPKGIEIEKASVLVGISVTQLQAIIASGKGPTILSAPGRPVILDQSETANLAEQMQALKRKMAG